MTSPLVVAPHKSLVAVELAGLQLLVIGVEELEDVLRRVLGAHGQVL